MAGARLPAALSHPAVIDSASPPTLPFRARSSPLHLPRPLKMFFLRSFPAGLSTRSLLATATATATRPLASSLAIRQRSDMPAGSSAGGSPPGDKQASAAAAPVDRAQSVSDFSQDSANKPDYVALVAAKEDRMKKAVQLWNEGQLCNQIAGSLGYVLCSGRGFPVERCREGDQEPDRAICRREAFADRRSVPSCSPHAPPASPELQHGETPRHQHDSRLSLGNGQA